MAIYQDCFSTTTIQIWKKERKKERTKERKKERKKQKKRLVQQYNGSEF